jgi:hypothetical protein
LGKELRILAATGLLLSSAGLGFLSANLLVVLVVHVVGPEAVVKVRHINDVGY